MSTIVHVRQVGGSSNVHVDKMQERLQTKLLRIMSKKSFFEKTYCQDQVQTPKSLREWTYKKCDPSPGNWEGTFSVQQPNQYYLSRCTSNHIDFGSEAKTRAVVEQSSFRAKLRGFDQVDKTACYTSGFRGRFFFSFAPK